MPINSEDFDFDGPGSGVNLALMTLPDDSPLATASYAERKAAFAPKPKAKNRVVIASMNPVKIGATKAAFIEMYSPSQYFVFESSMGISGVSDQPKSQAETRLGAENRARSVFDSFNDTLYSIGIEGGIEDGPDGMRSFAWVAIFDGQQMSCGQTAVFYLPKEVAQLVREGKELGEADDIVFSRINSKQGEGAIGLLTGNSITRLEYYTQAVIMALIPFKNEKLTWPAPAPEEHHFVPLDMALLSGPMDAAVRIESLDLPHVKDRKARIRHVRADGSLSNLSDFMSVPVSSLKPFPADQTPPYETVFGKDGGISINRAALTHPSVVISLPDRFIDAIKTYRQLTNAGLKEAKDAIEWGRFYLDLRTKNTDAEDQLKQNAIAAFADALRQANETENAKPAHGIERQESLSALHAAARLLSTVYPDLRGLTPVQAETLANMSMIDAQAAEIKQLNAKIAALEVDKRVQSQMIDTKNQQVLNLTTALRKANDLVDLLNAEPAKQGFQDGVRKSRKLHGPSDAQIEQMWEEGWEIAFEAAYAGASHFVRFERIEPLPQPEREEDEAQAAAEAAVPASSVSIVDLALSHAELEKPLVLNATYVPGPVTQKLTNEFPITNAILKYGTEAVKDALNQQAIAVGVQAATGKAWNADRALAHALLSAPSRSQTNDSEDDEIEDDYYDPINIDGLK